MMYLTRKYQVSSTYLNLKTKVIAALLCTDFWPSSASGLFRGKISSLIQQNFYKSYKMKCNYLKKLIYMKFFIRKTDGGIIA